MKHFHQHMDRFDAAARCTFVLNNNTNIPLSALESDKLLVRLGLEHGRGQHHAVEELVRQLRKDYPSLLSQPVDLEKHICFYLAAVSRATLLLAPAYGHCKWRSFTLILNCNINGFCIGW